MQSKINYNNQKALAPAVIARIYKVSRPTAGKWAEGGLYGENNLQVKKINNKLYVLDNETNHKELLYLKEKGMKYKNKIAFEKVKVPDSTVSSLDIKQLAELIHGLENLNVPFRYSLYDSGISHFASFLQSYAEYYNQSPKDIFQIIKDVFTKDQKVNLFNAGYITEKDWEFAKKQFKPATNWLISPFSQKSLSNKEFANFAQVDLEKDNIADLLLPLKNQRNLILLLGGYINRVANVENCLSNLTSSMNAEDLVLLEVLQPGKTTDLMFAEYDLHPGNFERIKNLAKLIGVNEDMYDLEHAFDTENQSLAINMELTKDINVEFPKMSPAVTLKFESKQEITFEKINLFYLDEIISILESENLEVLTFLRNSNQPSFYLLAKRALPMLKGQVGQENQL